MRWIAKSALLCFALNLIVSQELIASGSRTAVILFGGYSSCMLKTAPENINLFQPLKEKLQSFRQNLNMPFRYFLGCYRLEADKVYVTHDANPQNNLAIDLKKLGDVVNSWQNAGDPIDQFVLIGTSYGGWTVVQMLEQGLIDTQKITALFTLDPISRTDCTPQIMMKNILKFNGGYATVADNPCRRAPEYWKNLAFLEDLQWKNFYQTDYPLLHSSDSPYADENLKIEFTTPVIKNLAHRNIQTDERVWDEIFADLASVL